MTCVQNTNLNFTVKSMRRHITWTVCSCAIIIWAGTQSWAFQDDNPDPVGLNGILTAYAPDGLTEDDFAELEESIDETWKSWINETGVLVKSFYEEEKPTVAAQQEAVQKLRAKLNTIERALKDRRYRSVHDEISDLYLKLSPQVDMAEAVLSTLSITKEDALKARVAPSRNQLKNAVANFRSDMNKVKGGQPWLKWAMVGTLRDFDSANPESIEAVKTVKAKLEKRESFDESVKEFLSRDSFLTLEDALAAVQSAMKTTDAVSPAQLREEITALLDAVADFSDDPSAKSEAALRSQIAKVRSSAPDGGAALGGVFNKHYLNYNLRVVVSEGFLNRIAGDVRRESSRINDSALGARIVGNQTSDVTASVDIQPSQNNARFNIVLNGVVSTSSMAYASQATIRTVGRHTFNASKSVTFDGTSFQTEPARVSVRANNQPVGASTRYSGRLFGRMAEGIAMDEANNRRGQANSYTQRSIRDEVGPKFNTEVDSKFSDASMELQNRLYGPLREYGLYPDAMSYTSTSNAIHVRTRLSGENEIGGGQAAPGATAPGKGLMVQIHESLLTNGSNRLDLGTEGKLKMSEGDLRALIEERLSKIMDREVSLNDSEKEGDGKEITFIFDQPNPIRFVIDDGEVVLLLRAGLDREGDDIPTQIITVPLIPTVAGDKILLNRGNVGVKPVKRPKSVAEQVARANVMRQNIQKALPEKEFDASFEVEQDEKKISMNITSIDADNGWLSIVLE